MWAVPGRRARARVGGGQRGWGREEGGRDRDGHWGREPRRVRRASTGSDSALVFVHMINMCGVLGSRRRLYIARRTRRDTTRGTRRRFRVCASRTWFPASLVLVPLARAPLMVIDAFCAGSCCA